MPVTSWLLVLCLVLWLLTEASELVISCLLFKVSRKQKQTRKLQKSFHVWEFTVSVSTLSLSWYFVLFCNSVFSVPLVPLFPLCCVSPCPPSLCQSSCFSIFMFQHHISFHFFLFYFVFPHVLICFYFLFQFPSCVTVCFAILVFTCCWLPSPVPYSPSCHCIDRLFMTLSLTLVFVLPLWLCSSMRSFCH